MLSLEDHVKAAEIARRAAKEGWSVREVERKAAAERPKRPRPAPPKAPVVLALEQALQEHLQTRVEVKQGRGGKGSLEIRYHDAEDFERVFEVITGRPVSEVIE